MAASRKPGRFRQGVLRHGKAPADTAGCSGRAGPGTRLARPAPRAFEAKETSCETTSGPASHLNNGQGVLAGGRRVGRRVDSKGIAGE